MAEFLRVRNCYPFISTRSTGIIIAGSTSTPSFSSSTGVLEGTDIYFRWGEKAGKDSRTVPQNTNYRRRQYYDRDYIGYRYNLWLLWSPKNFFEGQQARMGSIRLLQSTTWIWLSVSWIANFARCQLLQVTHMPLSLCVMPIITTNVPTASMLSLESNRKIQSLNSWASGEELTLNWENLPHSS